MRTRLDVFKNFALDLAELSKCTERGVAAIITDLHLSQVLSIGTNGGPKGGADCLCVTDGKYGCVHAEINALIKCTSAETNKVMIVTVAPCKQCAAAIVNAPGGFSAVYYINDWKRAAGIEEAGITLLKSSGVLVEKL